MLLCKAKNNYIHVPYIDVMIRKTSGDCRTSAPQEQEVVSVATRRTPGRLITRPLCKCIQRLV